jgi:DNA-binding transcriptional regulator YhcF (GntR family)
LEEEGFIRIRDRSGAEIVAPARKPVGDQEHLRGELHNLLARMRQAGFSTQELRALAEREIASFADWAKK